MKIVPTNDKNPFCYNYFPVCKCILRFENHLHQSPFINRILSSFASGLKRTTSLSWATKFSLGMRGAIVFHEITRHWIRKVHNSGSLGEMNFQPTFTIIYGNVIQKFLFYSRISWHEIGVYDLGKGKTNNFQTLKMSS